MKQFEKKSLQFNDWTDYYSFEVPTYSKLLDVYIIHSTITILYEYDSTNYYDISKRFNLKVINADIAEINNLVPTNIFEYLKMITIEEPQKIETQSTFNGVNFNLSPLNEKKFLIFVNEIKSLDENRDEKLNNLLEAE
jgi:hypothetical protein